MLSELDLTDEMVQDGLAFGRLLEDDRTWPAIKRLLAKLNEDAIALWEADESDAYSKKWLRGYRQALTDVALRVEEKSQRAQNHVLAARETAKRERALSDDGMGSGDLAIA
jgi:hypothetical protein